MAKEHEARFKARRHSIDELADAWYAWMALRTAYERAQRMSITATSPAIWAAVRSALDLHSASVHGEHSQVIYRWLAREAARNSDPVMQSHASSREKIQRSRTAWWRWLLLALLVLRILAAL